MSNHSTKRDENHGAIVKALRDAGASVEDLAPVGGGIPDLLVGVDRGGRHSQRCFLLEVKMPKNKAGDPKPFTPLQVAWHAAWRGQVAVVTTPDEALRAVGLL